MIVFEPEHYSLTGRVEKYFSLTTLQYQKNYCIFAAA
jgi:hypothetical protein